MENLAFELGFVFNHYKRISSLFWQKDGPTTLKHIFFFKIHDSLLTTLTKLKNTHLTNMYNCCICDLPLISGLPLLNVYNRNTASGRNLFVGLFALQVALRAPLL